MEIRYYKEQQHNFMVIKQTESESQAAYHSKMLKSRKMDHLLKVNERIVNGDKYNYYDITSKLSLKQLLGSRSLSMSDITPFMDDLRGACKEIDNYLLDTARLVLDPDMIFYSHVKEKYYFLYNISTPVEESEHDIGLLMDYLLDKADSDDESASDLIYSLYEQYEKGILDVWGMLDIYDNYAAAGKKNDDSRNRSVSSIRGSSFSDLTAPDTPSDLKADPYFVYDNNDGPVPDPVPMPSPLPPAASAQSPARKTAPIIIAVIGILGLVACVTIRMLLKLDPDEELIWLAGTIVSILLSAAGIIWFVISSGKKNQTEPQPDSVAAFSDPANCPDIHMEDFIASPSRSARPVSSGSKQEHLNEDIEDVYAPPIEGQTVFFDGTSESGTYKLYALDRKNKKHIELTHLPVTIGKLNGYVDFVIDHPSISRMHAKLDMQGDRLMLSDLNSTNGVYLNGMRLSPNEVREIEEGDEIRFGSLNYCLRRCS